MLTDQDLVTSDIHAFLQRNLEKELLRFVAVGSVDDGKSTLIGRLLHDTKGVYDDQLKDATRTAATGAGTIDFSLLTDGLKAEREQGITIDVAYRYFSTPRRKFIIADTPGHVQYTRNMATGASTADLAIILLDARLGVLPQSRRHAYIASQLGIRHLLVCVNKMDLVGFSQERFEELRSEFSAFLASLQFHETTFIPISALLGDNVVSASEHTPWFKGTVLEHIETVPIAGDRNLTDFRFPVQYVIRPNLDYRGFAGQIASGMLRRGDTVKVLPSGTTAIVRAIDTHGGELEVAQAPQSVTLLLDREVDCSRGDVLVGAGLAPEVGQRFDASLVWMSSVPLDTSRSYLIKHCTRYIRANLGPVLARVDLETLRDEPAPELALNDIGRVRVTLHRPIVFDAYSRNRAMGAFIVIDSTTNNTVGAGMILGASAERVETEGSGVSARERSTRLGHVPGVVLVSSGGDAAAFAVERAAFDAGLFATVAPASRQTIEALVSAGLVAVVTGSDAELAALRAGLAEAGTKGVVSVDAAGVDEERLGALAIEALRGVGVLA